MDPSLLGWNLSYFKTMFKNASKILNVGKAKLGIKVRATDDFWNILEFQSSRYLSIIALEEGAYLPVSSEEWLCLKDFFTQHTIMRTLIGIGLDKFRKLREELKSRSVLFFVDHHIIPILLHSGQKLEDIIRSHEEFNRLAINLLKEEGFDPRESIIVYDTSTHCFFEVMAALSLVEKGYAVFLEGDILDMMIPTNGVPDGIAIKARNDGFTLKELVVFGEAVWQRAGCELLPESFVIEVKPDPSEASKGYAQLERYTSTGHFTKGLLVCPRKVGRESLSNEYSCLTWDDEGKEYFYEADVDKSRKPEIRDLVNVAQKIIEHVIH